MTYAQMAEVVEKCQSMCRNFGRRLCFSITGGDPILNPDFWPLLELLHKKRIIFSIMGNPFHLDESVCRRLKEMGCRRYQMSLDGLEKTHDWFRKPGSFRETLSKIKCLNDAGIRTIIMTTVSDKNIDEIPDIIDTVVAHQVGTFSFARYCPTKGEQEIGITPLRYRELLQKCDQKFKAYQAKGVSTYFNLKEHLWALYRYETGEFKIPKDAQKGIIYDGCNCANCHLTILPNGDIFACRRFESKVGNIFTDSLSDIWLHKMECYRNYDQFQKCSKCELLAWCRGCPAVAYGTTGSFYGADPQCWKEVKD